MDARTLDQRVQALAGYPLIGEKLARRFGELISKRDDWGLFRVNPLRFAQENDLPVRDTVELFVHAARVALFDFTFNQVCPWCGGVEYTYGGLSEIGHSTFRCTTCEVEHAATLDDRLEVSFTINPAVHTLALQPFSDLESYARTFFSENCERPAEVSALVRNATAGILHVPADGRTDVIFDAKVGEPLAIVSIDTHSRIRFKVVAGGPTEVSLSFQSHGPDVHDMEIGPGKVTVHVTNNRAGPIGGLVGVDLSATMKQLAAKYPSKWSPFLTGKMLLNNQSFRDLFRVQSLSPDLKLALKSLTLLFTDLKGSTQLYDRTGDVYAYQVVQEHFRLLHDAVRRHDGAIVKTMGDAVMASFSTSRDAFAAAVEMMQAMVAVNAKVKADGHETGLKVGLHEGSALAVNAESRLDYFGQTVNIAARVQALAQSGEIWLTESVLAAEGVAAAIERSGYQSERKVVSLKGVGTPTPVFRCVV